MKTKKQIKEKIKQISTLRRNLIVDCYEAKTKEHDYTIEDAKTIISTLKWVIK